MENVAILARVPSALRQAILARVPSALRQAILARVPSVLRQCAALCAELNHRALRDTLILNSPFSILHFQKVLHNGCSLRCQDGFRMKLHAVDRHGLMPHSHDLSSFVTGDDLEALRQRIRCSDQRMIARYHGLFARPLNSGSSVSTSTMLCLPCMSCCACSILPPNASQMA